MRLFNFKIFTTEYLSTSQTSENVSVAVADGLEDVESLNSMIVGSIALQDDIGAIEEDTQAGYGFSHDEGSLSVSAGVVQPLTFSITAKPLDELPGSKANPGDPNSFGADILVVSNGNFEG